MPLKLNTIVIAKNKKDTISPDDILPSIMSCDATQIVAHIIEDMMKINALKNDALNKFLYWLCILIRSKGLDIFLFISTQ